jgi:hypothetical protein
LYIYIIRWCVFLLYEQKKGQDRRHIHYICKMMSFLLQRAKIVEANLTKSLVWDPWANPCEFVDKIKRGDAKTDTRRGDDAALSSSDEGDDIYDHEDDDDDEEEGEEEEEYGSRYGAISSYFCSHCGEANNSSLLLNLRQDFGGLLATVGRCPLHIRLCSDCAVQYMASFNLALKKKAAAEAAATVTENGKGGRKRKLEDDEKKVAPKEEQEATAKRTKGEGKA